MDRLATMTTFAKVVKYASFSAAAVDLDISKALVSRHISDLESRFGVRLLNRTTRSVVPTEAGFCLFELCERILSDIGAGEAKVAAIKNDVEGDISVLCPIWIGTIDIAEAVIEFCKAYPKVNLKLKFEDVSANPHEFLTRGYDVCIIPSKIRNSAIMAKKIGELPFVLAAAPKYLGVRGEPTAIRELLHHDCLTRITETHWSFKGVAPISLRTRAKFSSNSFFSLCAAAKAGLGIAILPARVAAADLDGGHLRQILPGISVEARPLYAAFAPGRALPQKVRLLVTFFAEWFRLRSASPLADRWVIPISVAVPARRADATRDVGKKRGLKRRS
jgi:DNA-binding transcriptional LysR family regulator